MDRLDKHWQMNVRAIWLLLSSLPPAGTPARMSNLISSATLVFVASAETSTWDIVGRLGAVGGNGSRNTQGLIAIYGWAILVIISTQGPLSLIDWLWVMQKLTWDHCLFDVLYSTCRARPALPARFPVLSVVTRGLNNCRSYLNQSCLLHRL